jgi:hypothetical protein
MGRLLDELRGTELYRELCAEFPTPDGNLLEVTEDCTAGAAGRPRAEGW